MVGVKVRVFVGLYQVPVGVGVMVGVRVTVGVLVEVGVKVLVMVNVVVGGGQDMETETLSKVALVRTVGSPLATYNPA